RLFMDSVRLRNARLKGVLGVVVFVDRMRALMFEEPACVVPTPYKLEPHKLSRSRFPGTRQAINQDQVRVQLRIHEPVHLQYVQTTARNVSLRTDAEVRTF